MELPDNFSIEDLDRIQIINDGRVDVCFGLMVSLYVLNPHQNDVRKRLALCVQEYVERFREQLRWFLPPTGGRYQAVDKFKDNYLVEYLQTEDSPDKGFSIVFSGSEHYEAASPYRLSMMTNADFDRKDIGYLSGNLPFQWLTNNNPGAFQKFVHDWCKKLSPYHGYAGIGIIQSADYDQCRRTKPLVYPLAMRFPGLHAEYPVTLSIQLTDGIKGADWITILGDEFLERLGGKQKLIDQLDDNFTFYDYPGGTMIQAGPAPQIGDVKRKHIPRFYKQLGNILKPIRAEMNVTYLKPPLPGIDAKEKSEQWFARFD